MIGYGFSIWPGQNIRETESLNNRSCPYPSSAKNQLVLYRFVVYKPLDDSYNELAVISLSDVNSIVKCITLPALIIF